MSLAMTQNQRNHHLHGVSWMAMGAVVIFGAIVFINDTPTIEKKQLDNMVSEFQVQAAEKPKPKQKVERQPKPQNKAPAPPSLVADLSIGLSGVDFGFGSFSSGMDDIDASLLGDTDNVVMTSDMVDSPPRVAKSTPLQYPPRAKAQELEGYVVLSLFVTAEGQVEAVKVLESDPAGTFDEAAIKAVKSWTFTPAKYDGKAVDSWANQTIRFELG